MADEKDLNEEEQEMTVTLTLDDDTEVECVVLTIFNAGEHEYIALLPMEGADSEEGEVYLYRYSETKSWLKHLTSCWMPRNTMSWWARSRKNNQDNYDTEERLREKSRGFFQFIGKRARWLLFYRMPSCETCVK